MLLFNALARRFKNAKFGLKKLQTSFYSVLQNIFLYLEQFARDSRVTDIIIAYGARADKKKERTRVNIMALLVRAWAARHLWRTTCIYRRSYGVSWVQMHCSARIPNELTQLAGFRSCCYRLYAYKCTRLYYFQTKKTQVFSGKEAQPPS